jgi:hypothetical protein
MTPIIKSGQLVTVEPVLDPSGVTVGEAVLCKVRGRIMLHKVTAIRGGQVQISNNHGHVNGWTKVENVFGRLIKVEP